MEIKNIKAETLYHATYEKNKENILKEGLKFQKTHHYDDSRDDRIYLADDEDIAISYAETAEDYDGGNITVFAVKTNLIDKNSLDIDQNVLLSEDKEPHTFEYAKEIPAKVLQIV